MDRDHVSIPIEDENWEPRKARLARLKAVESVNGQNRQATSIFRVDPLLRTAVKKGDVDAFIQALETYTAEEGVSLADIFETQGPSGTSLFASLVRVAASIEKADILRALLEVRNVRWSFKNNRGDSPLHVAARAGNIDAAKLLIDVIHVGKSNDMGDTALHEAVKNGHCELTSLLLERCSRSVVNKESKWPLYLAVMRGNLEILNLLMVNNERKCPLYLAVETGNLKILKLLMPTEDDDEDEEDEGEEPEAERTSLAHGARMHQRLVEDEDEDEEYEDEEHEADKHEAERTSPVHGAGMHQRLGNLEILKLLMPEEHKHEGEEHEAESMSPVHGAVMPQRLAEDEDEDKQDEDEEYEGEEHEAEKHEAERTSPVHGAGMYQRLVTTPSSGYMKKPPPPPPPLPPCAFKKCEAVSMSPVHGAVMHQRLDMMKEMLEQKKLFYLRDDRGGTPLHLAAYRNYVDGVKFLVKQFASSAFECDGEGYLPIHVACKMGHLETIDELLGHWPHPEELLTCKEGQNILHVAAKYGMAGVVKHILGKAEHEKLINAKDKDGNTPLHVATLQWQPEVLFSLTRDKRVDLTFENNQNLTALDIVDEQLKEVDAPLHKSFTRIILESAKVPRSKDRAIHGHLGPRRDMKLLELDKLKAVVENRMIVATLIASVTFAAGFSVPGGYNDSNPDAGIATLLDKPIYDVFMICNTVAMYSSIITVGILLWTQINDAHAVYRAARNARVTLLIALATMSMAFMAGVYVTISKRTWIAVVALIIGITGLFVILGLYIALFVPLTYNCRLVQFFADCIIKAGISISKSKGWAIAPAQSGCPRTNPYESCYYATPPGCLGWGGLPPPPPPPPGRHH